MMKCRGTVCCVFIILSTSFISFYTLVYYTATSGIYLQYGRTHFISENFITTDNTRAFTSFFSSKFASFGELSSGDKPCAAITTLTVEAVKNITEFDYFRTVPNNHIPVYIYSAYLDERFDKLGSVVRIIGATKASVQNSTQLQLRCMLFYEQRGGNLSLFDEFRLQPLAVKLHVQHIREDHGYNYSAYFFYCPVPKEMKEGVKFVSLISETNCLTRSELVPVRNLSNSSLRPSDDSLAVCVKPMYGPYKNHMLLLEFIEFYKILGAKHFTFYNSSVNQNVNRILKTYMTDKIAEVLPWKLPLKSRVDIHTEGLLVSLNECVYRNMYKYKYVVFVDVDEFIIPRKHKDIPELLKFLNFKPQVIGGMLFRNTFFYLVWPDDKTMKDVTPKLTTLAKTSRAAYIFKPKTRSKLIVKPETVLEMGNHFTWQYLPNYKEMVVPDKLALNQHYRRCEKTNCTGGIKPMTDKTTHRFKDLLLSNVREKMKLLKF